MIWIFYMSIKFRVNFREDLFSRVLIFAMFFHNDYREKREIKDPAKLSINKG